MTFGNFVGFVGILLLQTFIILQNIRIEGMLVYM